MLTTRLVVWQEKQKEFQQAAKQAADEESFVLKSPDQQKDRHEATSP